MLAQIGERLHEEYLAEKREERRRKNLQKLEDEALVRPKKMQKRTEENPLEVGGERNMKQRIPINSITSILILKSMYASGSTGPFFADH